MKTKALRIPLFVVNSLLVLPLGCLVALVWANTYAESYYRMAHALSFWVNEVGVVFFFGLMTKEAREATLPGGDLFPWRRVGLPVVAAVGAVVVSIAIYLWYLQLVAEPMLMRVWVVTCAVDVAASYFIASLIFDRHPIVSFVLVIAIASNAIGIILIALINPTPTLPVVNGLLMIALAMGVALVMRKKGVTSFWPYLIVSGGLSWAGMHLSGIHTALALVPVVPLMPHSKRDQGFFVEPPAHCHDALSCFERVWETPVQFVLFFMGLVNAGVPMHGMEAGSWALPIALTVGRPIGVLIATELGVAAGLHRVPGVGWKELVVGGSAVSIGLTLALFFATTELSPGTLLQQTQAASLVTIAGAIVALLAAWLLGVGRFSRAPAHAERLA